MKDYSAYFIFSDLSLDALSKISVLSKRYGFEVDYGETFLEFEYSGRDAPLNVVKYFCALAKIVQKAEGELVCEVVNDEGDNEFEFYSIQQGKLVFQPGKIVRGDKEVIEV